MDDTPLNAENAIEDSPNSTLPPLSTVDNRSAGSLLREMREASHTDIETLASALKVSVQKLRALEADDYAALPAIFFARGLAANICRHLGQDPAAVLQKMPDEKPKFVQSSQGINTTLNQSHMPPMRMGRHSGTPRWLFAAFAAIALAGALLFAWPWIAARLGKPGLQSTAAPTSITTNSNEPIINAVEPSAPASTAVAASAPPVASASKPASAAAATSLATLAPATTAASSAATSPASAPSVSAASAPAGAQVLQVSATGDTWVRVRTPAGRTIYEGSLTAGQQQEIPIARYPVRVIIGKAENTQLVDRGQPFDLASVTSQGVARFNINP